MLEIILTAVLSMGFGLVLPKIIQIFVPKFRSLKITYPTNTTRYYAVVLFKEGSFWVHVDIPVGSPEAGVGSFKLSKRKTYVLVKLLLMTGMYNYTLYINGESIPMGQDWKNTLQLRGLPVNGFPSPYHLDKLFPGMNGKRRTQTDPKKGKKKRSVGRSVV